MEQKKIITLDLTDCKYLGEIHERIRVAFDFPEWYGANWDAFWDLLRSECDADELKIIGINTLSKKFDEQIWWSPNGCRVNPSKRELSRVS